jgi:hypothetical protein
LSSNAHAASLHAFVHRASSNTRETNAASGGDRESFPRPPGTSFCTRAATRRSDANARSRKPHDASGDAVGGVGGGFSDDGVDDVGGVEVSSGECAAARP